MKHISVIFSIFMMVSALCSSICSYRRAEGRIEQDVVNALRLALAELPSDVVSADTIRCYRSHLTIAELKDTACISMRTVCRDGRFDTEMVAEANCGFLTVFLLSDQRAPGLLLFIGIVWLAGSMWHIRRQKPEWMLGGVAYGGIVYAGDRFMTAEGRQIRLTPMQHALMAMFMNAEGHTLSKQQICEQLWPKKPDASDTLYTLVKRTKPIIEANSRLRIESNRGKSYRLETR